MIVNDKSAILDREKRRYVSLDEYIRNMKACSGFFKKYPWSPDVLRDEETGETWER